jgi:hypothetical protein
VLAFGFGAFDRMDEGEAALFVRGKVIVRVAVGGGF